MEMDLNTRPKARRYTCGWIQQETRNPNSNIPTPPKSSTPSEFPIYDDWECTPMRIAAPVNPESIVNSDDCRRLPPAPVWPTSPIKQPDNFATKRLELEFKEFILGERDAAVWAFPEEDSIMVWKGSVTGGEGSVFKGKQYKFSIRFPNEYPFKPPVVKFNRPAPFHPNVGSSCFRCYGKISLDILQQVGWSSAYGVRNLLLSIKTMLEDPNLSMPVNPEAATLWSDKKEYRKMVNKLYIYPRYGFRSRDNFDRRGTRHDRVGSFNNPILIMEPPIKPYNEDFRSKDGTYMIVSGGKQ